MFYFVDVFSSLTCFLFFLFLCLCLRELACSWTRSFGGQELNSFNCETREIHIVLRNYSQQAHDSLPVECPTLVFTHIPYTHMHMYTQCIHTEKGKIDFGKLIHWFQAIRGIYQNHMVPVEIYMLCLKKKWMRDIWIIIKSNF